MFFSTQIIVNATRPYARKDTNSVAISRHSPAECSRGCESCGDAVENWA